MPDSSLRVQGSVRNALDEHWTSHHRNTERTIKYERRRSEGYSPAEAAALAEHDEVPPYVYQEYPKALYALDGETIVVANAAEERQKLAEGYYATLAEQLAAREAFEADLSQPEETEESADAAPPVKRSHKKKVA